MPATGAWYAHECNGRFVAAGSCANADLHALFVDGVQGTVKPTGKGHTGSVFAPDPNATFASKAACLDAYKACRNGTANVRVQGGYFSHNAACDEAHAKRTFARQAKRNVKPDTRIVRGGYGASATK